MALLVAADAPRPRGYRPRAPAPAPTRSIRFEQNVGQVADRVELFARGRDYAMGVAQGALLFQADGARPLEMRLRGASRAAATGEGPARERVHYVKGRDRSRWFRDVPTFARVRCDGVYPGIDLLCRGAGGDAAYDFVLAPGADPKAIEVEFPDAASALVDGELRVETVTGTYSHSAPIAFQGRRQGTVRVPVRVEWEGRGEGRYGFRVGHYEPAHPLIIDPTVRYATKLGGTAEDKAFDLATSPDYALIMTGFTQSVDFIGAVNSNSGARDAFITRVKEEGTEVDFTVFFGGSGEDYGRSVSVDKFANIYVTGHTTSSDFPLLNELSDSYKGGDSDFFVAKFDIDGSPVWSTLLGGPFEDVSAGIAATKDGEVYIYGHTESLDFPYTGAPAPLRPFAGRTEPELRENRPDAFLIKLDTEGGIAWWTYFGGIALEDGRRVAVGPGDDAFVTGFTVSNNFPVLSSDPNGPLQSALNGSSDVYVARFDAATGSLVYSTLYGGSGFDLVLTLDVDPDGVATIGGQTSSTDLPGADPGTYGGGSADGWAVQIGALGSTLGFAYYLGGSEFDRVKAIAVDYAGNVYATGDTQSDTDFPLENPLQPTFGGATSDSFLTKITSSGTVLYSSFLGGLGNEDNYAVIVDNRGTVYMAGASTGPFPSVSPIQQPHSSFDTYVAVIDFDEDKDGLPDLWERHPFTAINGDTVDLPALGADPLRKNVLVEISYMEGRRPSDQALDWVREAFANAPVDNPDGSTGITLLIRIKDQQAPTVDLLGDWNSLTETYYWSGDTEGITYFQEIRDHPVHGFTQGLAAVAHYCLFAKRIRYKDNSASGIARPGSLVDSVGNDFIVSLGYMGKAGIGTDREQAGTFMHELGHTLGLLHGGADGELNKPNYLSVMNYYFQFEGLGDPLAAVPDFDFSDTKLPDLDENALYEQVGLGGAPGTLDGRRTKIMAGFLEVVITNASGAIDWNGSGGDPETDTYALDLNGDLLPIPGVIPGSVFVGHNDWANLVYNGGAVGDLGTILFPPDPALGISIAPSELDSEASSRSGIPTPENLRAHALKRRIFVGWKPRPDQNRKEGLSFRIYRASDGAAKLLATTTQSQYMDRDVEDGTEYSYAVTLVNESGTEGFAATATATTK